MNFNFKGNKQLCPKCQTGKDSYILDSKSAFCPYIGCHNGNECTEFIPLDKQKLISERIILNAEK